MTATVVFLLAVHVCTAQDHCTWKRIGHFLREGLCHQIGQTYLRDENVLGYKCVIQMRS